MPLADSGFAVQAVMAAVSAERQFFRHEAEMWSWFHVLGLRLPPSPAAVVSFRNELDPDITLHLHYS